MNGQSLAVHLEKLKQKEKLILCWVLNCTNQMGYQVHPGMLPFIKADDAIVALNKFGPGSMNPIATWRATSNILSKLKQWYAVADHSKWVMHLNDKKVAHRFGANPERGHRIPNVSKKRVTVGVRWSLPKRDHEPDDNVLVAPHMTLRCIQRGMWQVKCEAKYREVVTQFLVDHCL